jgi:hypothetical protein
LNKAIIDLKHTSKLNPDNAVVKPLLEETQGLSVGYQRFLNWLLPDRRGREYKGPPVKDGPFIFD